MRTAQLLCFALCAAGAWLALPGEAAAAPGPPSASCNGGGCGGWFKSGVTVSWSYDPAGVTSAPGCGSTTVTEDTGGATFTCTVYYGAAFYGNSVTVAKDSSPPSVEVRPERDPDANGWYTKPVGVSINGGDGASGLAGCSGGGTYSGPDGGEITLAGTCTDNAGNSGSGSIRLKYDGSPPAVTAAASRPPDANGWYNHEVQVAFSGTDPGSGVKECTPPVAYKGPDANPAKIVGQCRDNAGHLSQPISVDLLYDGTAPARPKVTKRARGRAVALGWTAATDVVAIEVVRAPGLKTKKAEVLFRGKGGKLVDRKTRGGTRYWYEIKVYDQAGNVASTTVNAKPVAGLYAPADGAVVRAPPLVAWDAVKGARFYNLQVWLGRVKVWTTWPKKPQLKLPPSWTFEGKRVRLHDGPYRVFVFPAFGTLKDPKFGKLVGQVRFVVKRR